MHILTKRKSGEPEEPLRAYEEGDFLLTGKIILLTEEPNVTKEV